jgi:hypothetical protein
MLADYIRRGSKIHPKAREHFMQRIPLGTKSHPADDYTYTYYNGVGATCAVGAALVAAALEKGYDVDQMIHDEVHESEADGVHSDDDVEAFLEAVGNEELSGELQSFLPREAWDDWREYQPWASPVTVAYVIYMLNDNYDLPREEIADLLEAWNLG